MIDTLKTYSTAHAIYVNTILSALITHYGDRLTSLAIFGSMARGENRRNSDCDLLMIVNDSEPPSRSQRLQDFTKLELSFPDQERACIESGVMVEWSPVIFTETEARHFNPLYLDMTDHLLILVDRDDFLARLIQKVARQKTRWGSKKQVLGNGWYWHIAPRLKWGESIDYDQ